MPRVCAETSLNCTTANPTTALVRVGLKTWGSALPLATLLWLITDIPVPPTPAPALCLVDQLPSSESPSPAQVSPDCAAPVPITAAPGLIFGWVVTVGEAVVVIVLERTGVKSRAIFPAVPGATSLKVQHLAVTFPAV